MRKDNKKTESYYDVLLNEMSRKNGFKSFGDCVYHQDYERLKKTIKSALFYESWEQTLNLLVENDNLKKEVKKLQKYLEVE